MAGCCSQWSVVQITLELTLTASLDSLCPHLHLLAGSVLIMIWCRWRHWHLDVYSRCPILPQRLENTSVVAAGIKGIKAFVCFFQCVTAMKCGNHYKKCGQPRSVEVCRRRGRRWHKQPSARMCLQRYSPAMLCRSSSACRCSLYSPSTMLWVLWAGSAPEHKSQSELHWAINL